LLAEELPAEPPETLRGMPVSGNTVFNFWPVKIESVGKISLVHAMNMYGEGKAFLHSSLISTLDGGGWSALCYGLFTPGETVAGTSFVGVWVGPRAGLNSLR
jgi:hypothetical protein